MEASAHPLNRLLHHSPFRRIGSLEALTFHRIGSGSILSSAESAVGCIPDRRSEAFWNRVVCSSSQPQRRLPRKFQPSATAARGTFSPPIDALSLLRRRQSFLIGRQMSSASATAARTKLQTFRLGTYVGRRLTLQWRAGYFTNPSATTDAHFAGSSDRRLQQLECRTSDQSHNVGRRTNLPSAFSNT